MRLAVLILALAALAGCAAPTTPAAPTKAAPPPSGTAAKPDPVTGLEQRYGARVGVFAVDTGNGHTVTHRADDRFAFDSTGKTLSAGVVLRQENATELAQIVHYTTADVQTYAPITKTHLGTGMSVHDLLAAALDYSDNAAANLLIARLGGPAALQASLRDLGDRTTNVDRTEPDLNYVAPGDVRDTTTPRQLGIDLRGFALGTWLTPSARTQLTTWLRANTTGSPYIRAAVPAGWTVGDKTGNGNYGSRNDIAVLWPPHGSPIVLVILTARGTPDAASNDALIADTTRAVLAELAG